MANEKILIVEDEDPIAELIEFNLRKNGFECKRVSSAEDALKLFERGGRFDLILLDLMLTGMDGTEFCRIFRSRGDFERVPIIILTARGEESDIVSGLDYGADDYITKPFSPRVLLARIRARLRSGEPHAGAFTVHGIMLDSEFHEAKIGAKHLDLTANEFSILELFMRNTGRVFSRDAIIRNLHGDGYPVTDRAVDVAILNLRRKLGGKSDLIETVRGVGYRMSH